MSILIKNMDMPTDCTDCPLKIYKCDLWKDLKATDYYLHRHKDCPLVEVKTPHGDLIDKDILYEKFAELDAQALEHTCNLGNEELNEEWRKWSAILRERTAFKHDVYDAPTVIESEE